MPDKEEFEIHTLKRNIRRAVAAACLCAAILLVGCGEQQNEAPDSGFVQMVNPLVTVNSAQEMEKYLGYPVPVLEKDVDAYIVLVIDGIAESGRIHYADGSVFNIKRGTGDISGIYGGILEENKIIGSDVQNGNIIGGTLVSFFVYEDTRYAIWETDGLSFSLTGNAALEDDIAALLAK